MGLDFYLDNNLGFNITHNLISMWKRAGCYDASL